MTTETLDVLTDSVAASLSAYPDPSPLELCDVVKTWKGVGTVLDRVNLTLPPGRAVHLSGRNGCGKTTLMRIAVGLIRPEAGIVSCAGLFPEHDRRRYQQQIGFLPAGDRALYARMTGRDHLRFWARLNFVARQDEAAAIERGIGRFGLASIADRRVDRMSQGQRQRVRLAGSFLHDPPVVLLDEPRNSLDDEGIECLVSWARERVSSGGSVLWCSPSGEAAELDFEVRYLLHDAQLQRL